MSVCVSARALGAVINTKMIAFVYLLCISIVIVKLSNEVTLSTHTQRVYVCVFLLLCIPSQSGQKEEKTATPSRPKFSNTTRYSVVLVINKSKIKE